MGLDGGRFSPLHVIIVAFCEYVKYAWKHFSQNVIVISFFLAYF